MPAAIVESPNPPVAKTVFAAPEHAKYHDHSRLRHIAPPPQRLACHAPFRYATALACRITRIFAASTSRTPIPRAKIGRATETALSCPQKNAYPEKPASISGHSGRAVHSQNLLPHKACICRRDSSAPHPPSAIGQPECGTQSRSLEVDRIERHAPPAPQRFVEPPNRRQPIAAPAPDAGCPAATSPSYRLLRRRILSPAPPRFQQDQSCVRSLPTNCKASVIPAAPAPTMQTSASI